MGVGLTLNEKQNVPKLHLHNSADRLNSFIIQNHRNIAKTEREEKKQEDKTNLNNKLIEGLGLGKKKVEVVKVKQLVKYKDHADTAVLRMILKMIPIEPIHTKPLSKLLRVSKRITEDGCQFLFENKLIHRSGQNRYRAV